MKLSVIYNVWCGVELLRGSMLCMKDEVDLFIIVYQDVSNFGEQYDPLPDMDLKGFNYVLVKYNPILDAGGFSNEKSKRNLGLDIARQHGCTHFLFADCDEYYTDFKQAKNEYINNGTRGSVCNIYTYFKKPTWRFQFEDNYYVPFIHELKHDTLAGSGEYPYWVDPTRKVNETNVTLLKTHMHHYSWVRKDINRKCRNSTARKNIERGGILNEYNNPAVGPGTHITDIFNQTLIEVPNHFSINVG